MADQGLECRSGTPKPDVVRMDRKDAKVLPCLWCVTVCLRVWSGPV